MSAATRIDHVQIAIPAGGEASARAFFGGVIGLVEIPKPAALAARGGCWFEIGAQQLHIGIDPAFQPACKAHVAIATTGLAALRERLTAGGYATRDDAEGDDRPRFFSTDPFGNRIEFVGVDA